MNDVRNKSIRSKEEEKTRESYLFIGIFSWSLVLLLVFRLELREALGDPRSITPALTPKTIELISYREFGYKFKIIPRDATPPTGFEQPGFNEDAFGFEFAFGSFGGGREGAIGG